MTFLLYKQDMNTKKKKKERTKKKDEKSGENSGILRLGFCDIDQRPNMTCVLAHYTRRLIISSHYLGMFTKWYP